MQSLRGSTRRGHAINAVVAVLAFIGGVALADTIHVPGDYPTIQAGIDAAFDDDEVVVADGIWTGPENRNLDFGGRNIVVRSASRDPELCVIDCEELGRGFVFQNGESSDAVLEGFTIRDGLATADLPGGARGGGIHCVDANPTIRHCWLNSNRVEDGTNHGGGLYCSSSTLMIEDCEFLGNSAGRGLDGAGGDGGGLFAEDSILDLINCRVRSNQAGFGGLDGIHGTRGGEGGGIRAIGGRVTIMDSEISSNSAGAGRDGTYEESGDGGSGGRGGGLCTVGSTVTIAQSEISSNSSGAGGDGEPEGNGRSGGHGGGLYAGGSTVTITDSQINSNFTGRGGGTVFGGMGAGGSGGGLCVVNASLDLADSDVTVNRTGSGGYNHNSNGPPGRGAGVYTWGSGPDTITRCTVSGNRGGPGDGGYGGGICAQRAVITDCVISDNETRGDYVAWGGGVYGSADTLLINCLIRGNTGWTAAGAYDCDLKNCTVTGSRQGPAVYGGSAANCVMWANAGGALDGATQASYSNVEGGWPGVGNIDADPLFTDPASGDYRLGAGSPCIDAADNDAVPDGITLDLEGNARFVDDPNTTDTGTGVCLLVDMGVYEYQEGVTNCCPADLDGSGAVDFGDILAILAAWGNAGGPEDLDDSGTVDFGDILEVLGAWGLCVRTTRRPADRCEDAWDAGDGSYPFSTHDAMTDGDSLPQSCDEGNGVLFRKDVWVRYVSSCNGVGMARVCASDFDTRLAIYEDGDCAGAPIACSDDACGENGTRSEVMFPVGKGSRYLVRIGASASRGEGVLVLTCIEGGGAPNRQRQR